MMSTSMLVCVHIAFDPQHGLVFLLLVTITNSGDLQVCKYIDIPLQHISNMTLLSMNRPPQEHTVKLLQKLRQRIPDLVLRTTFISGFPGKVSMSPRVTMLLLL